MFRRLFLLAMRLLGIVSSTALLAMMLLTFADVIGRYGFHHSIFGTAEIVEYLMVITIFAGLAFTTATNDHITITMFDGFIERHAADLRRWSVVLFSVFSYLLVTVELLRYGLDLYGTDKRSTVLDLPLWVQPIGAAVLLLVGGVLLVSGVLWSRGHFDLLRRELFRNGDGVP
ncbi:MAG: TRAP transporter small permease [Alphaproteobacteria bacterium]|nr:TRAP transporter small permease [Alphaproteobacteria bacterium]